MKQIIDCFFVGHNEITSAEHERMLRLMGTKSGAYRDLSLDLIQYDNKPYSVPDIYNLFHYENKIADDGFGRFSLGNVFSGAIAYLGTYISRRGFTFDYVNSFKDEKEYLIEKLKDNSIRLIAIPTTLYVSVHPILEIMSLIKKYNSTARIVLGGPFIAAQIRSLDEMSVQYLFKAINADFYIYSSQGENALVNILRALKENLPLDNIDNIFYRSGSRYVGTSIRHEDNRLDDNMVDWSLFTKRHGNLVNIRTSVSCPFSCSYCEYPQHAGKYQTASVEAVERELDAIAAMGTVSGVSFIDDTFNVPPERFKDMLRRFIRNRYDFKWNCFFRCQFADEEMVQLMKESGCEGVYLGIESGSNEILKNMNKATTVDKYKRGIELLRKYGITTVASILVGFPGETEETVRETVDFLEESGPDFLTAHLWYCSTITPIWKQREDYKIKGSQFEWSHETMNSKEACDLIYDIHSSIKNTIYIPQYNFDFAGVVNLLRRGMSIGQVKDFLNLFNKGVREKLSSPAPGNILNETAQKLKNACLY